MQASTDREFLARVLSESPDDPVRTKVLDRLARYFAELGKGPLDATPEELEGFKESLRGVDPRTTRKYLRYISRFYARAIEDGHSVSLAVAVAAGSVDPLQASPDREFLARVLSESPDNSIRTRVMRRVVRRLARYFAELGKGPLDATPEELEEFAESLHGVGPKTTREYMTFVGRFYARAIEEGHPVSLAVAAVVGLDPLQASPDREFLARVLSEGPDDPVQTRVVRRLARYFARLDKGPLDATPDELEGFAASFRNFGPLTIRAYRLYVRRFYERAFEAGHVSRVVAAAGGGGVAISPDRDALRAFIGSRSSHSRRAVALRRLANYFARLDKGPLDATPEELESFFRQFRFHTDLIQANYRYHIREFYRVSGRTAAWRATFRRWGEEPPSR